MRYFTGVQALPSNAESNVGKEHNKTVIGGPYPPGDCLFLIIWMLPVVNDTLENKLTVKKKASTEVLGMPFING